MWHELKAQSAVGSLGPFAQQHPTGSEELAFSEGRRYIDNCSVVCYRPSRWADALSSDPWADPTRPVWDPQEGVARQLKETVLKVLWNVAGLNEMGWRAADPHMLGMVAGVYRAAEHGGFRGVPEFAGPVSYSPTDFAFVGSAQASAGESAYETAELRARLVRVERELFEMRSQVSRLLAAHATASLSAKLIASRVDYNPAEAWKIAIERDGTTTPVPNLEELYE